MTKQCPKCESPRTAPLYEQCVRMPPPDTDEGPWQEEWLRWTCMVCGYGWRSETADKEQRADS